MSETKLLHFIVATDGWRLDKYLAQQNPEISRSYIQRLIRNGYVTINRREAKASQKLNKGDRIALLFLPPRVPTLTPEPIPLNIVYEDGDLFVIDKPAGLTVYPAPGHPSHTLINALIAYYPDLTAVGEPTRPGIVHRLDKDTSGLIVVAKNIVSQKALVHQFKTRSVFKSYLVLVQGKLSPEQGSIEAPIGRHPVHRQRMAVAPHGKEARTAYQVLEYLGNYTLLEVMPETGRTHQIRVHLSATGYPVAGDSIYGVKVPFLKRQFVHAHRLGLHLPSTGEFREFKSELPPDLKLALEITTS